MFKVGDLVWCNAWGKGKVREVKSDVQYPIVVDFDSGHIDTFTMKGKHLVGIAEPKVDITLYTGQDTAYDLIREGLEQAIAGDVTKLDPIVLATPTIADNIEQASTWDNTIPDNVKRYLLGNMGATIGYTHDQVSFGEADYATVEEIREAIEWLVTQFNGEVKWKCS